MNTTDKNQEKRFYINRIYELKLLRWYPDDFVLNQTKSELGSQFDQTIYTEVWDDIAPKLAAFLQNQHAILPNGCFDPILLESFRKSLGLE